MSKMISRMVHWFAAWPRFCALLTLIFLVRGVFVLSVLPPYEGWDEYQHIAYVVFLLENDGPPVLHNGDAVPPALYPDLVKYPHCDLAIQQLRGIGALGYDEFWEAAVPPTVSQNPPTLRLYQAQQSALYYRLVAPLYAWLSTRGGPLAALTGLRALNVGFGAAALCLALLALGHLVRPCAHRYMLALLIVAQPLFLLDCARVANDALAIFLGTLAVVTLLVFTPRHYLLAALVAGLALGFGVLAKAVNLGLMPFVAYVFLSLAWRRRRTSGVLSRLDRRDVRAARPRAFWGNTPAGRRCSPANGSRLTTRRALMGLVVFSLAATAVSFHQYYFNLRHFGMLAPMQEAVQNRAEGRTLSDFIEGATSLDWWHQISRRYLRHILWRGDWSMLSAPGLLVRVHQYLICLAALGGILLLRKDARRRRWLFRRRHVFGRLTVLCLGMTAALCYHMLQTYLVLPNVATNIWYAAVVFPWLLCLFYQGLAGYPRQWITHLLAAGMLVVYVATEMYGTLVSMVQAYTGHGWDRVAWDRLSQLHLPGLGPAITFPALALVVVLVLVAVAVWISAVRGGGDIKLSGPATNSR